MGHLYDGQIYSTTFDEADTLDANGNRKQNIILLKNENGRTITEMTDEQNAVAARSLAAQAEMQISTIDEVSTKKMKEQSRPASPTEDANKKLAIEQQSIVGNFAKLWYGDSTEVEESEDFLRGLNPDIIEFDRDKTSVVVTFADGTTETLSFKDSAGNPIDQASFIKGNVNKVLAAKTKIKDVEATLKKSQFDGTRKFNSTSIGFSAGDAAPGQESIDVAFKREIRDIKPPSRMIIQDNENASLPKVQQWMAKIPGISGNFTAVTYSDNSDFIEIKDKKGNVVSSIQFDKKPSAKTLQNFYDSIYELSMNNTSVEDKALKVQNKRKTIDATPRTSKKQAGMTPEELAAARTGKKVKLNGQ